MTFAQRLHSTLPFASLTSLLLAVLVMAGATTMADLMALTQIPAPPFMEEERGLASA
jgi:hypothetical protein